ncbi:inhibitor of nuclear factor kappa-B kinase subunit epsilon-like isoform X1 [Littorina saxatilis]|uniref:inhibitor of nuclear factor kappa-B kinase subunit epsilon-like isoform X1 n=2 Tax=Littorina saxatilis TaxID=31220 RepID=UPI0038B55E3F
MQVLRGVCGPPSTSPNFNCSCPQKFDVHPACITRSTPSSPNFIRHLGSVHGQDTCARGVMCSASDGSGACAPRQTPTHLFEEGDKIGKGGSCDVYCGVEKGSGARHALKVLRAPSQAQQSQLRQEAETLSKLSCPKIVRMLAQNFEMGSGQPVVVLEHCSGGSLLSFLQQPENARGLDDDQFLFLLRDLVDALSYLRGKGIVHRDIKPGNILRHIHSSGRCEYKLSDFGTSREAMDTEQTTSIVGTEEYLHPLMYKNAFFGNSTQSTINPISGELWSLGCTLYHAMTASVPFRPLGGARNNRKAMLVMISQKPSGAISGDQRLDGNFRWSEGPPGDCRMSESLRSKVIPLLQGLLDTDQRQWSFATFLDESQRILGLRCFHVCDTECGDLFRLYLEPRQSLAELQDALAYHTELPACQQLLFHRVQPLLSMLGAQALVSDLPATQDDQPLLLVSTHGTEGRGRRHVPVQPSLLTPDASLEEDMTSSFKACSALHVLSLMALTLHRLPNLLFSAILALRSALTSTLSTVETRFRVLSATCQERQTRLTILTQIRDTLRPTPPGGAPSRIDHARQLCDELRDTLWRLKYRLEDIRKSADVVRFDNPLPDALCHDDSSDALQHIFKSGKDIWQRIQERRQKIPLSEIEQEKHRGDKASLNRLCVEGTNRIKGLQDKRRTLLEKYAAHVQQLCERLEAAQDIEAQLLRLKEESEQFSALLNEIWATEFEDLRQLAEHSRRYDVLKTTAPIHNQLGHLLSEDLPVLETFNLNSTESSNK